MNMLTLLVADRIACETEVSSKKRAFERLSAMLATAQPSLDATNIFNALTSREKLGCTALGNGVAIPHACITINEPCGALLVLEDGIKMDAPDRKPVRILLALLVPAGKSDTYAPIMQELTQVLAQKNLIETFCNCQSSQHRLNCLHDAFMPEVMAETHYSQQPLAA